MAYTGCTDYDEDIEAINDRIDMLETSIKRVSGIIESLRTSTESFGNVLGFLEHLRPLIGKMNQEEKNNEQYSKNQAGNRGCKP